MPKYTIRVYGLWINQNNEILLSDERIGDLQFTKFPGGGMEKGEGPKDCLKREWQEELNAEIEILDHFYTTDFYQEAAFHKDTQVISIYYKIKPLVPARIITTSQKNNFTYEGEREESFRFVSIQEISEKDLKFPIDKYVIGLLQKEKTRQ